MRILRAALIALSALLPLQALAQSTVLQGGAWTPGHVPQYSSYGSQPVVIDGGGAAGGALGTTLSELGITSRSPTGAYPSSSSGNGPFGAHGCLYDAPITNATGYHFFCFDPNVGGSGLLAYGAGGTAAQQPLTMNINGAIYQFPFVLSGIVGPGSSTVNDIAAFNNSSGTLLKDTGVNWQAIPTANIAFTQTGTGAVATTQDAINRARPLFATDFMTAAQIADGTSRTDSIDVSAAINSCIAAGITAQKNCYLPAGTWKAAANQLVMKFLGAGPVQGVGITLYGDGPGATIIDTQGNTIAPVFLIKANAASSLGSISIVYGGVRDLAIQANVAGPAFQDGQNNFFDYMNQQYFSNLLVQNFNASSSSTCFRFNAVFSAVGMNLNCATSAGSTGGNDLFQFENVGYGQWHIGGSNGTNFIHLTNNYNTFNEFFIDCEVVQYCVVADGVNPSSNSFYAGNWSYSVNGVLETTGGNNHAFAPGINSIQPFLSAGTSTYFSMWNNSTLTPLASPIFSGAVTLSVASGNAIYSAYSGSYVGQFYEDTSGNTHISNNYSGGYLLLQQTGLGTIQELINSLDVSDATSTLRTFKTHLASMGTVPTCGTGCSSISAGGTDTKFVVNGSAAVTSVTANFGVSWGFTPTCTATSNVTSSPVAITSVSSSAITFGFSGATTATIYVHCIQ